MNIIQCNLSKAMQDIILKANFEIKANFITAALSWNTVFSISIEKC